MKYLKKFNESSCPIPGNTGGIGSYLRNVVKDLTNPKEVFAALDKERSTWDYNDYSSAMDLGACEEWNIAVGIFLNRIGIPAESYQGTPKNENLPPHYITISGDTILDFVVGQFWGYGLGDGINDVDRVTFTKDEYLDIYNSYDWKKL